MTERQEIIKLILDDKKKSNTYDRYPIRFLFMKLSQNSEEELIDLIKELTDLSKNEANHVNDIQFINLHNLLSFDDGWITKSHLLNFISSLDPRKDYIITGFSELIRFYSRNDLEALIISFMTNIESTTQRNKQRIYFVCYSLFEKISIELRSNSRNESINPILKPSFIVDDDQEQICVYYANSSFDNKYFQNSIKTSSQWLSLYKLQNINLNSGIVCISDTLVTLYEKAKPDNFVSIEKLDSNFKLLTTMFKMKLAIGEEGLFEDEFWKFLFDLCFEKSCFDLNKTVYSLFNVAKINSENFVQLFLRGDLKKKKLLYLFLIENQELVEHSAYLIEILSKSINCGFNTFEKDIVSEIDMTKDKIYFEGRKYYISKIRPEDVLSQADYYAQSINRAFHAFLETKIFNAKITEDDLFSISVEKICNKYKVTEQYFRSIFSSFFDSFLSRIVLCLTKYEKQLLLILLQNSLIDFKDVASLYPSLAAYVGNVTSTCVSNSMQWIISYLYEYRMSKIMHTPTEKYSALVQKNAQDFPRWYIDDTVSPVFEVLKDKKYDVLVVLDGVGAEYFEYILHVLKENQKAVNYANICKCFLPSITEMNKVQYEGKYDEWITDFDREIIHGTFYRPEEIINNALDKIRSLLEQIIRKYKGKRVAIISDHGSTASGKILGCKKKYSFESEHEGRCMRLEAISNVLSSQDLDYYKYTASDYSNWLISLNGYSLADNPKRESHGGATVEEVMIPCIIFSDDEEDEAINYSATLLSPAISGLNRNITVEILPQVESAPILEEENGDRHVMNCVGINMWKSSINEVKTQNVRILIADQEIVLTVKGSMGLSIEGDGFDDELG